MWETTGGDAGGNAACSSDFGSAYKAVDLKPDSVLFLLSSQNLRSLCDTLGIAAINYVGMTESESGIAGRALCAKLDDQISSNTEYCPLSSSARDEGSLPQARV